MIALRRVPAIFEFQHLYGTSAVPADCFHLRHGSVLIVESLDDKHRAADAGQVLFDVPAAEIGMEPDVVPSPESAGGIAVIAAKAFPQICGFEAHLGFGDAADAEVFDENVRGEQDGAA